MKARKRDYNVCPEGGANAASQHRAGRERSHVSLSPPVGRPSLSRIVPMFTSRTHRAPVARGHRQYLIGKQEWR
jgi:hypothetical protein